MKPVVGNCPHGAQRIYRRTSNACSDRNPAQIHRNDERRARDQKDSNKMTARLGWTRVWEFLKGPHRNGPNDPGATDPYQTTATEKRETQMVRRDLERRIGAHGGLNTVSRI